MEKRAVSLVLLVSVFVVAICSLIYELIAGAVSSYLLGSSVTQFSLVIGIFLSAMGLGSYLSKFIEKDLISNFINVEIATGFVGGCSALLLFWAFTWTHAFYTVLVVVTGGVGTLIGLEIPLIIRILRNREESLRLTVANVMTADYVGALVASLSFPFFLVPHVGLMRSSFLMGFLNLAVGFLCIEYFKEELGGRLGGLRLKAVLATALILTGFFGSEHLVAFIEDGLYPDEIITAIQTRYQRIIVTKWRQDVRLFLNGRLQFSTVDEYRYHEALIHPAMSIAHSRQRVLVLGGGDGMAVREILKYKDVKTIELVDLDPEMTRIFKDIDVLARLNRHSLRSPKLTIINDDAMHFLEHCVKTYDVIYMDLPDPSSLALGKLYSVSFFQLLAKRLDANGVFTVQSSSPFYSPDAFWCIVNTIDSIKTPVTGPEATFNVAPYHTHVPSFGEWGYVLASPRRIDMSKARVTVPTRFLDTPTMLKLFSFSKDLARRKTQLNRLNNQIVVQYYLQNYADFYD